MKQCVLIISGPTAVGKSDFVNEVSLALHDRIEVINADIGSLYTPLTIGTAKPDWQASKIQHHFFDIFDRPEYWTAPQFRAALQILIPEIWQRGNIPVIVGGSAFYVQSFFYKNYEMQTPPQKLLDQLEMQTAEQLWQALYAIDQDRAEEIEMQDKYRLIRALAIWHTQHKKPSLFKQTFAPLFPFYGITLTRDRDELYEMINQRVHKMLEQGWLAEVQTLLHDQAWVEFLHKKKMIGYNELLSYLQGHFEQSDFNNLVALIAQRTRNYAKRQLTFLKKMEEQVTQDMTKHPDERYKNACITSYNLSQVVTDQIIINIQRYIESTP